MSAKYFYIYSQTKIKWLITPWKNMKINFLWRKNTKSNLPQSKKLVLYMFICSEWRYMIFYTQNSRFFFLPYKHIEPKKPILQTDKISNSNESYLIIEPIVFLDVCDICEYYWQTIFSFIFMKHVVILIFDTPVVITCDSHI